MDDITSSSQSESGEGSQSGQSGGTGRWGTWMQDYESGNYDSLPHDEIISTYRDWSATAQPEHVHEATSYGYQNVPQDRWGDAGQQWNSEDLTRVATRSYSGSQEEEEEEGGGIPKPLIGLALAGALAYAASRFMSSGEEDNKESDTSTTEYLGSEQGSTTFSSSTSEETSGTSFDAGTTGTWDTGSTGSTTGSTGTWDTGTTGSTTESTGTWDTGSTDSGSMSGSLGSSSDLGSSGMSDSSGGSSALGGSGSGSSGSTSGGSTSS